MARLASQEKLGYYKTPVKIVEQIKAAFEFGPKLRMLDPCCGEGEALAIMAKGVENATSVGIEVEKGRFEKAEKVLDRAYFADALAEANVNRGCIDLLWLNPPYDIDEGDYSQDRKRLEVLFLKKYMASLSVKGVLVFIVPWKVLIKSEAMEVLANGRDLQVYRFPDTYFDFFKQVVVIMRKGIIMRDEYQKNLRWFWGLNDDSVQELPSTEEMTTINLEANKRPTPLKVWANHVDPVALAPLAAPLNNKVFSEIHPPMLINVRPVTILREGHLATMLATGYINGELHDKGENLVVKGSVKRDWTSVDESTETHRITKTIDKAVISVRVLNLDTGEFYDIAQQ